VNGAVLYEFSFRFILYKPKPVNNIHVKAVHLRLSRQIMNYDILRDIYGAILVSRDLVLLNILKWDLCEITDVNVSQVCRNVSIA
jgi:hypothetical protein